MNEEIENLKKDINNFIEEDILGSQKYVDRYDMLDIINKNFHDGRVSAFEQVLELLENI